MYFKRHWRDVRKARGWTLETAAEKIGIKKAALSKIERGEIFVSEETLARACEIYDCQPGDLYERFEGDSKELAVA